MLDAIIGGVSSNSYVTGSDFDIFVTDRFYDSSSYAAASDSEKTGSMITATAFIDTLDFVGTPANTSQALQWPRSGVLKLNGGFEPTDDHPTRLKNATYLLALALLKGVISVTPSNSQFKSIGIGPIKLGEPIKRSKIKWPAVVFREFGALVIGSSRVVRQ